MKKLVCAVAAFAVGAALVAGPGARAESTCVSSSSPEQTGALPYGFTICNGVRPGMAVSSPGGSCTLNFVFQGGDGHRYMGTAGHCIVGNGTADKVFDTPGPVAKVDGARIGEFAYAVHGDRRDFALIRLDPGVEVSPELAHFGGPVGVYTEHSTTPVVLHHYGELSLTSVVKARTGIAPNTLSNIGVAMVGTGVWGDSGSAVIDRHGRAVGVLVTLTGSYASAVGTNGITRLDHQLPYAESALGTSLTLMTAPVRSALARTPA